MSTSDPFGVPLELRGLLGQVSAGANTSPLPASPLPGALAGSSPGISGAAATPIAAPTLPDPSDPSALALLVTRVANDLFGGGSIVPVPSPQQAVTGAGAAAPASPGISPTLAPGPLPAAGGPSVPAEPSAAAPPPSVPPVPSAPLVSGAAPQLGSPAAFAAPGLPSASPGAASSHAPAPPTGLGSVPASGDPSAAADSQLIPEAPNPFGHDAFSLDGFELEFPDELVRMPLFDSGSVDAAPHGQPAPGERAPRIESVSDPFQPLGAPAIRDLGGAAFDPYAARRDFPILDERIHGKRLVWLDNAATTQKPRAVIDRLALYYERENSNVHRGAHTLAARATDAYETGREITRRFLNASGADEIVFVRGATEGINLIAKSWGRRNVQRGDEIVITHLEHHANIVPWQQLCAETGARLRVAPVDDRGAVILEEYDRLLNPRTRLVAFPQVSNALGTITPAREMVELAHRHGAVVLVDGAQAVSHMRVDVQALDCDFYVFSGHKVFAPTGIGAVFGKRDVLAAMPPWQGGGNMIQDVTFERTTYHAPPMRFEAGTGSIADAAGLGAALEYVMRIGMDVIDRYEHDLLVYGTERLQTVPGLTLIGTSPNKAGVLSFVLDGQRTEDVGAALDKDGIAVRSGHHCAQPIHRRFGLEGTVRASLAFYNVCEDIDALVEALHRLQAGRGF